MRTSAPAASPRVKESISKPPVRKSLAAWPPSFLMKRRSKQPITLSTTPARSSKPVNRSARYGNACAPRRDNTDRFHHRDTGSRRNNVNCQLLNRKAKQGRRKVARRGFHSTINIQNSTLFLIKVCSSRILFRIVLGPFQPQTSYLILDGSESRTGWSNMKLVRPMLFALAFAAAFFYFTTWRSNSVGEGHSTNWFGRPTQVEITEAAPNESLDGEEQNNISVYKRNIPSVVNVTSRAVTFDFFYGLVPQEGQGSGFVIDKEGHILTNYHV